MNRHVLITGARGYLGGRLVVALAENAALRLTGTTRHAAEKPTGWPDGVALTILDPSSADPDALAHGLASIDTVIHLAAPNEIVSARDPVEALVGAGVASLKLLLAARRAGCRRFVYLSTIHVYGSPLEGRITEERLPKPVHPYAIGHRTAEDFVLAAHAKRDIEGVVLRLSNGIGAPAWPGVDRWSLIGNELCREAVTHGRVTLRSSGLQWRDFILLRDFVTAIGHVVALPAEKLGDGLFNLGGRLPLRMIDVAELVAARAGLLLGKDIPIVRPLPAADEHWPEIDFAIDRIAATGFTPSPAANLAHEIDATLALCRTTWA